MNNDVMKMGWEGGRWAAKIRILLACLLGLGILSGCDLLKKKPPEENVDLSALAAKPLPPEEAKEVLNKVGGDFLYGEGLGNTAINIGTSVLFPPYALYLLGNGVLNLSGYESIHITDALPADSRQAWNSAYSEVASGPGRVAAAAAGKEFRTEERINNDMRAMMQKIANEQKSVKLGGAAASVGQ